jgi:hypothetical protein
VTQVSAIGPLGIDYVQADDDLAPDEAVSGQA